MREEVANMSRMKQTVEEKFSAMEDRLTQEVLRSTKLAGQVRL